VDEKLSVLKKKLPGVQKALEQLGGANINASINGGTGAMVAQIAPASAPVAADGHVEESVLVSSPVGDGPSSAVVEVAVETEKLMEVEKKAKHAQVLISNFKQIIQFSPTTPQFCLLLLFVHFPVELQTLLQTS